jgi:predicted LPLAT superfamily acyltransferase
MARKERGSAWALGLMRAASLVLGRRLSRLVLPFIAAYYTVTAPAARRASLAYLSRALGRQAGWLDVVRHFHAFASTVHDRAYLLNDRFDEFDIRLHGQGEVDRVSAAGGAFLVGAHFGSFEVLRAVTRGSQAGARPYRVAMAMFDENARIISSAVAALNPRLAQDVIALGRSDSMLRVQSALNEGALVGFLADRLIGDSEAQGSQVVSFLGAPALFPTGPFRLAALLRKEVLLMRGIYLGGNQYAVRFESIADFSRIGPAERNASIGRAVERFAAALEDDCRKHPYNWFNFFDFWEIR